jgi:transcriptional regulator with XRE-family HTH domain
MGAFGVNQADIGKKLGLPQETVSRILRNRPAKKDTMETIDLVLDTADSDGYVYKARAPHTRTAAKTPAAPATAPALNFFPNLPPKVTEVKYIETFIVDDRRYDIEKTSDAYRVWRGGCGILTRPTIEEARQEIHDLARMTLLAEAQKAERKAAELKKTYDRLGADRFYLALFMKVEDA